MAKNAIEQIVKAAESWENSPSPSTKNPYFNWCEKQERKGLRSFFHPESRPQELSANKSRIK